jgi:hypothetical protein
VAATLTSVSVAPHSTSAWAVGEHSTLQGSQAMYVVHRHGAHWKRVRISGGSDAQLFAIAAASPKSVWAVGHTGASETSQPLIERSTGGKFRKVRPGVDFGSGAFQAAAASSPSNVWAVGLPPPFTTSLPIVAHWNGHKWSVVDDSAQKGYNPVSVSTTGSKNVWILGTKRSHNTASIWDGHTMTTIPVPVPPHTALSAITTTGANTTWVVGWTQRHPSSPLKTFTTHWNGKKWKRVRAPSPSHDSQGTSISGAGKRVYLAGVGLSNSFDPKQTPYFARLVHGTWKLVHAPTRGKSSNLSAISISSKSGAAVGSYASRIKQGPTQWPWAASLHGKTWHGRTAPR